MQTKHFLAKQFTEQKVCVELYCLMRGQGESQLHIIAGLVSVLYIKNLTLD